MTVLFGHAYTLRWTTPLGSGAGAIGGSSSGRRRTLKTNRNSGGSPLGSSRPCVGASGRDASLPDAHHRVSRDNCGNRKCAGRCAQRLGEEAPRASGVRGTHDVPECEPVQDCCVLFTQRWAPPVAIPVGLHDRDAGGKGRGVLGLAPRVAVI